MQLLTFNLLLLAGQRSTYNTCKSLDYSNLSCVIQMSFLCSFLLLPVAVEVSNEEELQRHGSFCKDFTEMELPSFLPTYVFLARVPLDVLHACLRLRLQQTSQAAQPSFLSLGQLIRECKVRWAD